MVYVSYSLMALSLAPLLEEAYKRLAKSRLTKAQIADRIYNAVHAALAELSA